MKQLLLVRGLPGAGKSTLSKSLVSSGAFDLHLEADQFFESSGSYQFDASQLGRAHKWCQDETRYALEGDKSVVVSNTFTTPKELKDYFDIALDNNILPQVILCQGTFGSIHNVPYETLVKMGERFVYDISEINRKYRVLLGEKIGEANL